jgi:hypothetical protein
VALALLENVGSTQVMKHVGMRYEKMAQFFGLEVAYYTLAREDHPRVNSSSPDPG